MMKSLTALALLALARGTQGVTVATGGENELCALDFETIRVDGPEADYPVIEITNQGTTFVEFLVHNVWTSPGSVDEVYVNYRETLFGTECVMYTELGPWESSDVPLRAECMVTQPITVVDVYVRDPVFESNPGTGEVPQCCHADTSVEIPKASYTFILSCVPTCEGEPPSWYAPEQLCGNGVVDGEGEECDDGNDIDDDECTNECKLGKFCGNGVVDDGTEETCDDGFSNGTPSSPCRDDCTMCGDGVLDMGEMCDEGSANGTPSSSCRTDCTKCGDGNMDTEHGEECDDGPMGSSTCTPQCKLRHCGDGTVDDNETCDDGSDNGTPQSTCRSDCTMCGDGVMDAGETCDDGSDNGTSGSSCRTDCTMCGDGIMDVGEMCDDGSDNGTPNSSCRTDCTMCGDGHMDSSQGEECDDGPMGSASCTPQCTLRHCGDGTVDAGETCDDGSLNGTPESACRSDCTMCGDGSMDNGETCDEGADNGTPNSDCRIDCTKCGDGNMDFGETCDDGSANGTPSSSCRTDCTMCGDGVMDFGEMCDDGSANGTPSSSCRTDCTKCGDGHMDTEHGEECDDGPTGSSTCTPQCKLRHCGDGTVDANETCDDGTDNGTPQSTCRSDCTMCGDGVMDASETCDDGSSNGTPSSSCRTDCTMCGDGIMDVGEMCDDGSDNGTPSSSCRTDCTMCGDGHMDTEHGEECDGGPMGSSTCTPQCTLRYCGDGTVDAGETCDDGSANGTPSSICRSDCTKCGDGIMDPGETCDDGADNGRPGYCRTDCSICGDGVMDTDYGEECDDGPAGSATCTPQCMLVPLDCPEVIVDFNDLPSGGFIYDEWWTTKGFKVIAKQVNSAGYTPHPKNGCMTSELSCYCNYNPSNPQSCSSWQPDKSSEGGAARIFNTNQPKGYSSNSYEERKGWSNPMCNPSNSGDGDADLGSPNDSCGGPGSGSGGVFGQTFANCPEKYVGNALVVQEYQKTCPDDIEGSGGFTITFEFNPNVHGDVEFTYAQFIDTDGGAPNIYFFDDISSGSHFRQEGAANTGSNGLVSKTFGSNPNGVQKVTFEFPHSGALSEIRFIPSLCEATPVCGNGIVEEGEECDDGNLIDGDGCSAQCELECPEVVVDFNDLPSGGFVYDEWQDSKGILVSVVGRNSKKYTPRPKSGCTTGELNCYCNYNPSNPTSCSGWQPNLSSGAARVFDTSRPKASSNPDWHNEMCSGSNGDSDLGSPANTCNLVGKPKGPGNQGSSHVTGFYSNCPDEPIGNVLIIQENKSTCPDDVGSSGGVISFEFDVNMYGGVYFTFAKFLDIDDGVKNPFIEFWQVGSSDNNDSLTTYTDRTEENGLHDLSFRVAPSDIKKISIDYPGSGCIAEIRFRPSICPEVRSRTKRNLRRKV